MPTVVVDRHKTRSTVRAVLTAGRWIPSEVPLFARRCSPDLRSSQIAARTAGYSRRWEVHSCLWCKARTRLLRDTCCLLRCAQQAVKVDDGQREGCAALGVLLPGRIGPGLDLRCANGCCQPQLQASVRQMEAKGNASGQIWQARRSMTNGGQRLNEFASLPATHQRLYSLQSGPAGSGKVAVVE